VKRITFLRDISSLDFSIFVAIETRGVRFKGSVRLINWMRSRDTCSRYVEEEPEREREICREFIVAHKLIYQGGSDLSACPRCGPAGDRRDSETDWPISLARHFERTGLPVQRCGIRQARRASICGSRFSVFSRPSDVARLYQKRMIRAIDLRCSTSDTKA